MGSNDRRERERSELRQRILDASRILFAEKGYEAVTIRTIADAVEYSPRTIYLYFKDKEDLIRQLCVEDFRGFSEGTAQLLAIPDPLERLRALGHAYARFGIEHPNHYKLMFMSRPPDKLDIENPDKGDPERDAYALLLGCVREAMGQGLLRPEFTSPDLVAQVIWSGMHGVVALHITHCPSDWIEWAPVAQRIESMIDVTTRGLRR